MKLLVKTRGPYSLVDPYYRQMIRKNGYSVVTMTPFVEQQRGYQIDTVAELPDAATDEDWLAYVEGSKGDLDLAKASFLSSFDSEDKPKRPYNRKKDG